MLTNLTNSQQKKSNSTWLADLARAKWGGVRFRSLVISDSNVLPQRQKLQGQCFDGGTRLAFREELQQKTDTELKR